MAGRRKYKSAYRMTSRRKSALRKAQLVSARKRKGSGSGNLKKIGILAAFAVGSAYAGHKFGGQAADVASSVRRKLRFNNPANKAAMTPAGLEANMVQNAVSPAAVARQAQPVNAPNMNNTSTPAPSTNGGPAAKGVPGFGGAIANPTKVTQVPSAGRAVDPYGVEQLEKAADPNTRTIHPMVEKYGRERIVQGLAKIGVAPENATWKEIKTLSDAWVASLRQNGKRIGVKESQQIYTSILDVMGVDPKWLVEKKAKEAAKKA